MAPSGAIFYFSIDLLNFHHFHYRINHTDHIAALITGAEHL